MKRKYLPLTPPQELFVHFIKEREHARECKEHGIFPHSDDPIIRDYKFCNINREHDRVTIWIRDNIRNDRRLSSKDGKSALVHELALARVFNHPPTLEALWALDRKRKAATLFPMMAKILYEKRLTGKIFRGAYKMPAHGSSGLGGSSVDYFLANLQEIWKMDFSHCYTLEDVANLIQTARGFGPFLANQIVTDLRYTRHFKDARDWGTFVLCGPGTKRGLCRFFGLKPRKGGSQATALRQLKEAREILYPHLDSPFTEYFRDPNNVANSFCEYSKYARALEGGAPPKSKYRPFQEPIPKPVYRTENE